MVPIRSIEEIAEKWASVTPMRSADYAAGIKNPSRSWSKATQAAEGAYEAGVQAAVARHAFAKGVAKAGDEKWQRKASVEGVARWGPGVSGARGEYQAGFAPYREAINQVTLPPRYARRDPRNMLRVKAIVDAMIARYLSIQGR